MYKIVKSVICPVLPIIGVTTGKQFAGNAAVAVVVNAAPFTLSEGVTIHPDNALSIP